MTMMPFVHIQMRPTNLDFVTISTRLNLAFSKRESQCLSSGGRSGLVEKG